MILSGKKITKDFYLSFILKRLLSLVFSTQPKKIAVEMTRKKSLPLTIQNCSNFDCSVCLSHCPTQAISRDGQVLFFQNTTCVECEICFEVCPKHLIKRVHS